MEHEPRRARGGHGRAPHIARLAASIARAIAGTGPSRMHRDDLNYLADRIGATVASGSQAVSMGVLAAQRRADAGMPQTAGVIR